MDEEIWKFPLLIEQITSIEMPQEAKVLAVQSQFNEPQMWVLVKPVNKKETRHFETFGTGHVIPYLSIGKEREYIGTYQVDDGNYVYHVFELISGRYFK